jgi:hypothetical protein
MLYQVPTIIKSNLDYFRTLSGIKKFYLIGGTGIDCLLDYDCHSSDWDIVINKEDYRTFANVLSFITSSHCTISKIRNYRINKTQDCKVFLVHGDVCTFDVAYVDDMSFVGPFDVESLYISYPDLLVFDTHSTIESIHDKRINLIRQPFINEEPLILLKRFLYLTAKYDIPFGKSSKNWKTVEDLTLLYSYRNFRSTNEASLEEHAACISKLLKGLLRTKDRSSYVRDIVQSKLLTYDFDALHELFIRDDFNQHLLSKHFSSKTHLLEQILAFSDNADIRQVLLAIRNRYWDTDDRPS